VREGGREGGREERKEAVYIHTCKIDEVELAKGGLGRTAWHA
jgi:hypothetical protein